MNYSSDTMDGREIGIIGYCKVILSSMKCYDISSWSKISYKCIFQILGKPLKGEKKYIIDMLLEEMQS
jgi:hypothetical protein